MYKLNNAKNFFKNKNSALPYQYKIIDKEEQITTLNYGCYPTKFGICLIALEGKNIYHLSFVNMDEEKSLQMLQKQWRLTYFKKINVKEIVQNIFNNKVKSSELPYNLVLKGTPFQIETWLTLMQIPSGSLVSYEDIALQIGKPKAIRAVATAIGRNEISYLIPCHRVIRKSGKISKYRWGIACKELLINHELVC